MLASTEAKLCFFFFSLGLSSRPHPLHWSAVSWPPTPQPATPRAPHWWLLLPVIYGLCSLLSSHCEQLTGSQHLVFLLGWYFISPSNPRRRKPVTHFQPDTTVETGEKQRWGTKQAIVPFLVRVGPASETLARKKNVVYHRELLSPSIALHQVPT